jgi:hypothetical protein
MKKSIKKLLILLKIYSTFRRSGGVVTIVDFCIGHLNKIVIFFYNGFFFFWKRFYKGLKKIENSVVGLKKDY